AAHPERVRGLVVVDIAPRVERAGVEAIKSQISRRDFASIEEAAAHAHAFNPRRTLENVRERMRHGLKQRPDGRWTYKFDAAVLGGETSALARLWNYVRRIRCPPLLVRGGESNILAAETAERFTHELPGSSTAEVPGAG